mmetsp:Transcript_9259/g.25957  ORF Transcript_9259/g.25957 Transcript_9259/m.25957 type:complete len:220 (+) Transcript_9259:842-1501(+)
MQGQAHECNGLLSRWQRTKQRVLHPLCPQVLLQHLCLAHGAQLPHVGKGTEEGCQHRRRELLHKLLRAIQWCRLRSSKVCNPMGKVESHILRLGTAALDQVLESVEKCSRGGLALDQPAIVEAHLPLRESDQPLALLVQPAVGGEYVAEEGQDVIKSNVMVADDLSLSVVAEGRMRCLHCGAEGLVLHHVVDGSQDEHCLQPVFTHARRVRACGHLPHL